MHTCLLSIRHAATSGTQTLLCQTAIHPALTHLSFVTACFFGRTQRGKRDMLGARCFHATRAHRCAATWAVQNQAEHRRLKSLSLVFKSCNGVGEAEARAFHRKLLANLLRLPMSFFDTTPLGRVLNRFSKDSLGGWVLAPVCFFEGSAAEASSSVKPWGLTIGHGLRRDGEAAG